MVKKSISMLCVTKAENLHPGKVMVDALVKIWKIFVLPIASYVVHHVPMTLELVHQ